MDYVVDVMLKNKNRIKSGDTNFLETAWNVVVSTSLTCYHSSHGVSTQAVF